MAWKVAYRNSFLKTFKKLPKNIQNEILDIADKIQSGDDCEKLQYSWKDFYSCHFGRKPEYRLLYIKYKCLLNTGDKFECQFDDIEHTTSELKNCNGLIEFVLVNTRENFNRLYKQSKKQIKNLRRE